MPGVPLLVYSHLLFTGVLAALALLLKLRFPYPETTAWFRITLALLVACALAVLPLLGAGDFSLLWIPFTAFALATISFVVFSVQVIRSHFDRMRK